MPLRDHFRLEPQRPQWPAIHSGWMTLMAMHLNEHVLGQRYFAEASAHLNAGLEIDLGTFDREATSTAVNNRTEMQAAGGTTTLSPDVTTWTAPTADRSIAIAFPDEFAVRVYDHESGSLVAAVELVSPANKDRRSKRDAFVTKCASYLQGGIGLVIIDIVTIRRLNLHGQLLEFLGADAGAFAEEHPLYATSYRPYLAGEAVQPTELADIWERPLEIGAALPTVPLPLRDGPTIPLELEETYERVCAGYRID